MHSSALSNSAGAPRVLLVNYEFPPLGGGAGNATANIARELARLGVEVMVLTSAFGNLPRRETLDGYDVVRVPTIRRRLHASSVPEMACFMVSAMFAARRWGRDWRPAATIAFFSIPGGPIAWLLRRSDAIPYIVSLRGGDVPGFAYRGIGLFHRLTGGIITRIWRDARAVVANSAGLAALARQHAPDVAISVIPNGVDVERFTPRWAPNDRTGRPQLIFVGRLVHQKGVDLLLSALARLPAKARPFLLIIGDGPIRAALTQQAARLGLAGDVKFAGWVARDDLPALYRQSDIMVMPSRDEGMPNVVLEAMACSLPVIASRVAGNVDLVDEGVTGRTFESDDVGQLATAIAELASAPALATQLGAAGRRKVEREYSWKRVAEGYLAQLGLAAKISSTE